MAGRPAGARRGRPPFRSAQQISSPFASFLNSGQICLAASRILVEQTADGFYERFAAAFACRSRSAIRSRSIAGAALRRASSASFSFRLRSSTAAAASRPCSSGAASSP